MPNHFKISADITRTSSTLAYCHFDISQDNTEIYNIGVLREKGSLSIRQQIGSTYMVADNNSSIIPLNSQKTIEYEYNNGLHSLSANNITITGNDTTQFNRFSRLHVEKYTVQNLKIKAL